MLGLKRDLRDRHLIAVIADADMVTGMLLAGIGHHDTRRPTPNYFIVDPKSTTDAEVEAAFRELTERRDIALVLITQQAADRIRHVVDEYAEVLPALLEIPSKDVPYDPEKDSLLKRINKLCSNE